MDLSKITAWELGQHLEPLMLCGNEEKLREICEKAVKYNCRAVNAAPMWLPITREILKGTNTKVGGGISFPLGFDMPKTKAYICEQLLEGGVESMDFLINYEALKAGRDDIVKEELRLIKDLCKDIECKSIFEVAMLTDEEIKRASSYAVEAGIDYIKTSTGTMAGPTMPQLKIIFDAVAGSATKVKVSGVKAPRPQNAFAYFATGVDIIGSQGAFEIIESLDLMREMGVVPAYKE
ncbi:MAG: deoxyribose-phosphate aldolase [Lachnospiraceae bacterium]|nr:deoxyribose-phosphate aldolase [Lachnospiraceae bacterium]